MPAPLIMTNLGIVPEDELDITLKRQDDGDSWTITRICVYKGPHHPHARNQIVRQDVWVTMKTGIKSGVTSGI